VGVKGSQEGYEYGSNIFLKSIRCIVFTISNFIIILL